MALQIERKTLMKQVEMPNDTLSFRFTIEQFFDDFNDYESETFSLDESEVEFYFYIDFDKNYLRISIVTDPDDKENVKKYEWKCWLENTNGQKFFETEGNFYFN